MSVYVVGQSEADEAPIKIGRSGNVQDRLSTLSTGSPTPLLLHATIENEVWHKGNLDELPDEFVEKRLHEFLKLYAVEQLRGEWFNMSAVQLHAALPLYSRWLWDNHSVSAYFWFDNTEGNEQ